MTLCLRLQKNGLYSQIKRELLLFAGRGGTSRIADKKKSKREHIRALDQVRNLVIESSYGKSRQRFIKQQADRWPRQRQAKLFQRQ